MNENAEAYFPGIDDEDDLDALPDKHNPEDKLSVSVHEVNGWRTCFRDPQPEQESESVWETRMNKYEKYEAALALLPKAPRTD